RQGGDAHEPSTRRAVDARVQPARADTPSDRRLRFTSVRAGYPNSSARRANGVTQPWWPNRAPTLPIPMRDEWDLVVRVLPDEAASSRHPDIRVGDGAYLVQVLCRPNRPIEDLPRRAVPVKHDRNRRLGYGIGDHRSDGPHVIGRDSRYG